MNNKGFSLIETLITTMVFVMVLLTIVSSIISVNSSFINTYTTYSLEIDSCHAARGIADQIKNTSRNRVTINTDTPFSGSDQIDISHPKMIDSDLDGIVDVPEIINGVVQWDGTVTVIGLDPNDSKKLIAEKGSAAKVLANNVESIRFFNVNSDATLAWDEIRIQLTLSKTNVLGRLYRTSVNIIVNMRNTE